MKTSTNRILSGKANQPSYSPKLLKSVIPPHMKVNFHREKSSSTSTLFMNSTIKAPDNDEILKWYVSIPFGPHSLLTSPSMSLALYWNIKKYEEAPKKKLNDVFSEEIYPLVSRRRSLRRSELTLFHRMTMLTPTHCRRKIAFTSS